jgi:taurine--2-oxoglutarate transaminase
LGGKLFSRLQQLQACHPVIGDVRGGHGLFVVLELVADPVGKTPLSPWPQVHPTLAALQKAALGKGISFAVRGNLLIIAPPLIIEEQDLWQALTVLDALLAEFFSTPSR